MVFFIRSTIGIFLKCFMCLFLERGEDREKEREPSMHEGDVHWLPLVHPQLGTLCVP